MAASDAKPVPRKNVAYRVTFPILDADGDLVTGAATLDSEVSKDGGTFTDCTSEASEIATASGVYNLDLTSTEMNADTVALIVKTGTAGAKTTTIVMYPEELGDYRVDTVVSVSGNVGGSVGSVIGNVGGSVASVLGNVGSVSGGVTGSVGSVVGNVGGSVGSVAGGVTGSVGSVVGNVGGSVGSVVGNVGGVVAGSVGSVVGNVGGFVGSVVGNVGGSVGSVAGNVGGSVGSVVGNVGGSVASVLGNIGSVSGGVTGSVGSVVGNVGGSVASVVGNVGGSVGSVTGGVVVATNNDKTGYALSATGSAALTEDYPADGAAGTLNQVLYAILQNLEEFAISDKVITVKKRDGSTTAMQYSMDSSVSPTSRTRF